MAESGYIWRKVDIDEGPDMAESGYIWRKVDIASRPDMAESGYIWRKVDIDEGVGIEAGYGRIRIYMEVSRY